MKGYSLLFCCALLVSIAYCTTFNFPNIPRQYVGVESDWFFVSVHNTYDSNGTTTISMDSDPDDITIIPSTMEINGTNREASFRLKPQTQGDYVLTFSVSDGTIEMRDVYVYNRTISIEGLPSASLIQGFMSEPFQVQLDYPSFDDLTITPMSDTTSVVFQPKAIVIPAGAVAATFKVTANVLEQSHITWTVQGFESDTYSPIAPTIISNIYPRTLVIGGLSSNGIIGQNSTSFYVYTPVPTETSVTVTPTAVDTDFTPLSAAFTPSSRLASFSLTSRSPAYGQRNVYFTVSGPGASEFQITESRYTTITQKLFTIQKPTDFILNKKTYMSVQLGSPVVKDVTVYLYAGNLVFSPNNVTFKGDTTSAVIEVWPQAIGSDIISFDLEGTDKDWYIAPTDIPLTVVGGTFFSPKQWYIPLLWVGVESPQIPVRVSIAPSENVTLIPQAADLIFNPPRLTFSASKMLQYFTITPTQTNIPASSTTETTTQITFIVDGGEYSSFVTPDPITVTVGRRSLQFKWSAHVTETVLGVKDLYLGKQYEFWATALYAPPINLTVVPTNSYMTFQPSVLAFGPTVSHIKVIATVNNIPPGTGNTNVDWIVGGKCGGLYTTPTYQPVTITVRPLGLYKSLIAPDDRVFNGYTADFSNTYDTVSLLGGNHVYWFTLRTNVIPDKSVTITPKSKHILFDPPSFELTFDKALLNLTKIVRLTNNVGYYVPDLYVVTDKFEVNALAPGKHEVWFELSGPDAPYYDIPDHVMVMSTKELRLASEMSSANMRVVSLTLLLLSILGVILL